MEDIGKTETNSAEKKIALDRLLLAEIGRIYYEFDVSEVIRIHSLKRSLIFSIPFDVSGRIRGMFNYKGEVIPLIRREGMVADTDINGSESLTALILRFKGYHFAVLIDQAKIIEACHSVDSHNIISTETLYYGTEFFGDV